MISPAVVALSDFIILSPVVAARRRVAGYRPETAQPAGCEQTKDWWCCRAIVDITERKAAE
jgi:hypothetical protein